MSTIIKLFDKLNTTFQNPKDIFQNCFVDVQHKEVLNGEETLDFIIPFIRAYNIAIEDFVEYDQHKFIVRRIETIHDEKGRYVQISCEGIYSLLMEKIITPSDPNADILDTELYGVDVATVLNKIISGTSFTVGRVDDFGTWDIDLIDKNGMEIINELRDNWLGVDVAEKFNIIPPDMVTNFNAILNSDKVYLTWADPADIKWIGTKIVRKLGAEPININDGTVIVNCTTKNLYQNTAAIDSIKLYSGVYVYYKPFTYDASGNYNSQGPIQILTYNTFTLGNVTNLTIAPSSNKILLNWTDPSDVNWRGTRVVRKQGSYPINENDGTIVIETSVRNAYQLTSLIDTNVVNGTMYYYKLFPYDVNNKFNYSDLNNVSTIPIDYSLKPISNLRFERLGNEVRINWVDPTSTRWRGTLVVRKVGGYPTSQNDGTIIINSTTKNAYALNQYLDIVPDNRNYYYGVYPYDVNNEYNLDEENTFCAYANISPPSEVTDFNVEATIQYMNITWTDPTDSDWACTKLVRKLGSEPASPTDGTLLVTSTILNDYAVNGYIDKSVSVFKKYYYKCFPIDKDGNVNLTCPSIAKTLLDVTPPNSVTNFTCTAMDDGIHLKWTDPVDEDFVGTKVVRQIDNYPTYIDDGVLVFDSKVRNAYQSTDLIDEGIMPGNTYYYQLFTYDTSDNINTSTVASRATITFIATPTANVSNISIFPTKSSFKLRWTDPEDNDWMGTRIVRKAGSAPENEEDGILIADVIVRNAYQNEDLINIGVSQATTYYYGFFPYDKFSVYNTNIENIASSILIENVPPANVTSKSITATTSEITIKWTDPNDADWVGTKLIRKESSYPYVSNYPVNETDGTVIYTSLIKNEYQTNGFVDNNVEPHKMYYYLIVPYDTNENYNINTTNRLSIELRDTTMPGNVSNISYSANKTHIAVNWTDPSDDDWAGTKLVRKAGSYPISYNDGTLIVNNTTRNAYQTNVYQDATALYGTTYYYQLFTYDRYGNYNNNITNRFTITYTDTWPTEPVTGFTLTAYSDRIKIIYTDPTDTDWVRTKIVRKVGSYPTTDIDGTTVINTATKNQYTGGYWDTGANVLGTWYYYRVFTYDTRGNINNSVQDFNTPNKVITFDSYEDSSNFSTLTNCNVNTYNSFLAMANNATAIMNNITIPSGSTGKLYIDASSSGGPINLFINNTLVKSSTSYSSNNPITLSSGTNIIKFTCTASGQINNISIVYKA